MIYPFKCQNGKCALIIELSCGVSQYPGELIGCKRCGQRTMKRTLTVPVVNTSTCSAAYWDPQYNHGLGKVITTKRQWHDEVNRQNVQPLWDQKPTVPIQPNTHLTSTDIRNWQKKEGIFRTEEEWKGDGPLQLPADEYLNLPEVDWQGDIDGYQYDPIEQDPELIQDG